MTLLLLASVMAAAPSSAAPRPVKLAAPGLTAVGVEPALATVCVQTLAEQLAGRGVQVVTAKEMEALLGLERQRQLLGCTDESSCLAELGNALGVDGLVLGELARFGRVYQLNVKVVSARDGSRLAGASRRIDSEEAIPEVLAELAQGLASELARSLGRAPADSGGKRGTLGLKFWGPTAAGGALVLAGGVLWTQAKARHDQLTTRLDEPYTFAQAQELQAAESTFQTLAWVGMGVGLASIATGVVLGLTDRSGGPATAVVLDPRGGAYVSVGGTLP